ncbi:20681_t:CDS:2 [Funneliformis geosporum]|nr:20681_t:CDS:2 [Funneliformis geosporum]
MLITEEPKVVSVEDCSISEDAVEICYSTRNSSINWSFFLISIANLDEHPSAVCIKSDVPLSPEVIREIIDARGQEHPSDPSLKNNQHSSQNIDWDKEIEIIYDLYAKFSY